MVIKEDFFDKYTKQEIELLYRSRPRRTSTHKNIMDNLNKTIYWSLSNEESLHCYKNKINKFPTCPHCDNKRKFRTSPYMYYKTCSSKKCSAKEMVENTDVELRTEVAKQTCIERYGVDNFWKSDEFKRMREDNKEEWEPNRIKKMKSSFLNKYGVESSLSLKSVKDKIKNTCIEKYGSITYIGSDEHKRYMGERRKENDGYRITKYLEALRKKYNDPTINSPMQIPGVMEKCKKTRLERYGCEWPMQSYDSYMKNMKACFRLKEYTDNNNKVHLLQGHEPEVFDILTKCYNVESLDSDCNLLPYIKLSNNSRYYPDLFDLTNKIIYEVKSPYTYSKDIEKIKLSFDSVEALGFKYIVCLYLNGYICFIDNKDQVV